MLIWKALTAANNWRLFLCQGECGVTFVKPAVMKSELLAHPRLIYPLSQKGLALTEARNQMPTTLLFRDGILIDQRPGAQSFDVLREIVAAAAR